MMKVSAALVALMALQANAKAASPAGEHFGDGKYAEALSDFLGQITDSLTAVLSGDKNGRRLNADVSTDAKTFLADALAGLSKSAETAVTNAKKIGDKIHYKYTEATKESVLSDIMGKSFLKNLTDIDLLDKMGIDSGVYTKLMDDLANADSFSEAYDLISEASVESDICTKPKFTESTKEPTKCEGPTVSLELVPKECIIDSKTHTIDCTPAKLVLKKTPGSCTFKHHTAFSWKGKECKLSKTFGKSDTETKGGDDYQVYLQHPKAH